ncbi:MAG: Asp-tRNA(Asn)/Glu-tRNA(Gln) amidotransferase subunit GatB [Candidatus Woesearchaeota archaeon]|nr:Asp-tRNA(Asn)/Glu-tRNA(Gln) amidotransferase subunit GatB [Candidatus Woesearchaeota archaeon]
MTQNFTSDIVIGLEIHVELNTKTKLFCGCATKGNEDPNTRTCPTCLGHPGSKPVLNQDALEFALKLCIALDADVSPEIVFSRKSYFYPDMSKNFQITQYEVPLAKDGKLKLKAGKTIGIAKLHLEEDPASLVHIGSMQQSPFVLVDYNRSGNPLVEVVTKPELESPEEARDFMNQLISILAYLRIFDINNGIIKADANVSIRESGYVRAEVKNITGFKDIERALSYEVERQKKEIEEGKKLKQETRAWDSEKGITFLLRTKETEEDYGYIIEPDLTRIEISSELVERIKEAMPELAHEKAKRFASQYKIKKEDAEVLAQEFMLAKLYEQVAKEIDPLLAAKWLRRELPRVLNYIKKDLEEVELDETHIIDLLDLVEKKVITEQVAQRLLEKLVESPFDVKKYVKDQGMEAVSDKKELEKFCIEAIAENPKAVEDYKKGNEKALNFIVGSVMKKTKGKATPVEVNEILKKLVK